MGRTGAGGFTRAPGGKGFQFGFGPDLDEEPPTRGQRLGLADAAAGALAGRADPAGGMLYSGGRISYGRWGCRRLLRRWLLGYSRLTRGPTKTGFSR